jgi:hypothetical protein
MDEETRKALEKQLLGLDSRLKAKMDEALIGLKELYDNMTADDRKMLKSWIEKVTPLGNSPLAGQLQGALHVELKYHMGPDTLKSGGLPPVAIKRAIEHWERGEHYTPTSHHELGL